MGCVSEGGCLGPKRRHRDVYAQLIDNIHQQARKIQFSDNLNIYNAIRQKLLKKGYLRKLLDNLTSHRANIGESLTYSLRLTTQSGHIENKYAGLIVLNQIVNNLYKQKKTSDLTFSQEKTFFKTNSSNKVLVCPEKQNPMPVLTIDLRTQVQYFRLVTHLLENEGRMYSKILESIIRFSVTKKQPFGCKSQVLRVLELIMKKIQQGTLLDQSTAAYLALIQQLRESHDQIDYQYVIKSFIRLWLFKKNEIQAYQGAEQRLEAKFEQILRELIRRSICSSKLNSIYRAMFTIYDGQRFSGSKAIQMQDLIFKIIKQNDLHSPVIRGIFIYMLQYLSVNINNRERSFSVRSSGLQEFQNSRYSRIMEKGGRLRAFQTLRRWSDKQYFNLQQFISFSSSALVTAFTVNLSLDKQYAKQVMKQFLRLTEPLHSKNTMILVNLLMEQIKIQNSNDSLRLMLIALVRQVISERGLLEKNRTMNSICLVAIDGTFSKQSRLELIQLMGFIAKRLPSECFVVTDSNNSQFSQNLCQFLHSVYQGIIYPGTDVRANKKPEDDDILFRYQFANSAISFIKCLCEKGAYPFTLCFISSIVGCINQDTLQDKLSVYFMLYFIYEGTHLLNSKQKIPDKMVAVNFKISPSVRAIEIKPEIEGVFDNLVGSRGENLQRLVSGIQATLQQLRSSIMITANEYNQASMFFGDYFKDRARKDSMFIENSKNQFRRQSYNGSVMQSSGERSKMEDDSSFKDVIDRILDI